MAGLEQLIEYLKNLEFTDEDIEYLRAKKLFDERFLEYLADFKFTCDVWAVPEGTPIFPGEPLITVRGPVMQAQFIETMLLLIINLSLIHIFIPKMFGMKKAYERVAETGRVYSEKSDKYNQGITEFDKLMESEGMDQDGKGGNIWFFVIPLAVVIAVSLVTGDILIGLAAAIIVMLIMYLPTKALSFEGFCEGFASGFASMVPMMFITIGAVSYTHLDVYKRQGMWYPLSEGNKEGRTVRRRGRRIGEP